MKTRNASPSSITALDQLMAPTNPGRFEALDSLLTYIESDPGLYDADRLAFRELLQSMLADVAKDSSLPAIKLHKRISEDLDALGEIERNYEKEIRQIFGSLGQRAIELKRERWDDYVAQLKKLYSREQILKDNGIVVPYAVPPATPSTGRAGSQAHAKKRGGGNLRPGLAEEDHRADLRRRPAPPLHGRNQRHPETVWRAGRVLQRGHATWAAWMRKATPS